MNEVVGFKKLVRCFKTKHLMPLGIFYTRLDVSGSITQNNLGKKRMYHDGCNYC
jgi:hypothetical protein